MANEQFNSVACGDQFTDAATIRDVFGSGGGVFEVQGNPVSYTLQFGGQGEDFWTQEATIGTGGGTIPPGVTGVRFRNFIAGSVATVSALIRHKNQPHLSLSFAAPTFPSFANLNVVFDSILTVAAASFDVPSIGNGFRALQGFLYARGDNAGGTVNVNLELNGDAVAANYYNQFVIALNAGFANGVADPAVGVPPWAQIPGAAAAAGMFGAAELLLTNYATATGFKPYLGRFHTASNGPTDYRSGELDGLWRSTAPITRVTVLPSAGNFVAGSRFTLYGLG